MVTGADKSGNVPVHGTAAFLTSDFGRTWRPITLPHGMKDLQAMSCMPNGHCYLVYDTRTNLYSVMAMSADGGRTWRHIRHAQGFTSEGGFSCPTDQSCVYLGDHVLEVSNGRGPDWQRLPGPFADPTLASRSTAAYALSCVSVDQCMVGGVLDEPSSDQVVWIEMPPWAESKVVRALKSVDGHNNASFVAALGKLNESSDATDAHAAFTAFLTDIQANVAAVDTLAVHAHWQEQAAIRAVGSRWNDLLQTLYNAVRVNDAGLGSASLGWTLRSDVRAIGAAERQAGDPVGMSSFGIAA
jgi:hypothetical protein